MTSSDLFIPVTTDEEVGGRGGRMRRGLDDEGRDGRRKGRTIKSIERRKEGIEERKRWIQNKGRKGVKGKLRDERKGR